MEVNNEVKAVERKRLQRNFYDRPGLTLARDLLGQVLVRISEEGERLEGLIVETEAYLGHEDPCCHCYQKKHTPKTKAMFMTPGTAYVYNTYYRYCCFNISCKGDGAVVLIRSVEPIKGNVTMHIRRMKNKKHKYQTIPQHLLANGPSKLCMAFGITKNNCNELDLVQEDRIWLENGTHIESTDIKTSTRVGLGKHLSEEYRNKEWRFYISSNKSVSVKDKISKEATNSSEHVRNKTQNKRTYTPRRRPLEIGTCS